MLINFSHHVEPCLAFNQNHTIFSSLQVPMNKCDRNLWILITDRIVISKGKLYLRYWILTPPNLANRHKDNKCHQFLQYFIRWVLPELIDPSNRVFQTKGNRFLTFSSDFIIQTLITNVIIALGVISWSFWYTILCG